MTHFREAVVPVGWRSRSDPTRKGFDSAIRTVSPASARISNVFPPDFSCGFFGLRGESSFWGGCLVGIVVCPIEIVTESFHSGIRDDGGRELPGLVAADALRRGPKADFEIAASVVAERSSYVLWDPGKRPGKKTRASAPTLDMGRKSPRATGVRAQPGIAEPPPVDNRLCG